MRVAIDAMPLLVRSAGVKNYLYYWIEHLRRLAGDDVIRTVPRLYPLAPVSITMLPPRARCALFWDWARSRISNYTPLPVLDWASRGCDVFHATNLVRRPPRRPRLTSTIHDMTSWIMPELHSAATRRADAATARYPAARAPADRGFGIHQARRGAHPGHSSGTHHRDPFGHSASILRDDAR